MTLLVLTGGARAGKSRLAVELGIRSDGPVTFVATAEAHDSEMVERIERHRRERPSGWTTLEEPLALRTAVAGIDAHSLVIVDCLTIWVANLLERGDTAEEIVEEARAVADVAAARDGDVIAVTNEVGLGVVPGTELGRAYRDALGAVNHEFVARSARAAFVIAGRLLPLEPADIATWA